MGNKQRLEKIKARQEVLVKIADDAKAKLTQDLKGDPLKSFVTKLIVQGLLMFLETEVTVRCREADAKVVESCLQAASDEYAKVIKNETGAAKSVKITVDKSNYLPSSCLGGIALGCAGGKITIDNTIDARLQLVMEQDKPAIRKSLFPN